MKAYETLSETMLELRPDFKLEDKFFSFEVIFWPLFRTHFLLNSYQHRKEGSIHAEGFDRANSTYRVCIYRNDRYHSFIL